MGLSMRELMTLDIVARDEASPVIEKVSGAAKAASLQSGLAYKQASIRALTYSKVLRGVSKGLTLYGIAATAAAAFAGKQAVDFEKQMALVRTQTDLTNKQFNTLTKSMLKLATTTSRPIDELTQGLYDIFSGINVSGPQAIDMLESIAKAATAGDTDIRTTTRATLAQLNAFGLGAEKTNKILDMQFQLLRKSTGTYEELASAIGNVQPSAVAAGQSLLQVNAGLGFITKAGYSFSEASTRVARAMDYITRPSVAKGMHNFGVEVFNSEGKIRNLSDIVKDFGKRLEPLTEEKRKHVLADIFGAGEARANSFFNLATAGWRQYQRELKEVSKSHGALNNANDKLKDTTSVLWGKMVNQLKVVAIQFGDVILPSLNKIIEGVGKVFDWLSKLPKPVKETVGQFLIWSGIISLILSRVLKLSAGFLGIVSMRLWSGMAAGAEGAALSISKLGGAVAGTLGKFTLWGSVIAGIVYLFIKNFDTIKKWFSGFINWWKDHWQGIWEDIKPILDAVVKGFMAVLQDVGKIIIGVIGWIGKFIAKMLEIKPVVQGVVVFLLTVIGVKLVQGIVTALSTIMLAFIKFGQSLAVAVKSNWVTLLIAAMVTAAVLIVQNWAKVKDFFSKMFNGLARTAAQVGNFFIRFLVNPIIQGVNTVIHALNFLSLGFADLQTFKPVEPIKIPDKYISNLKDATSSTGTLSSNTGALGGNAKGAAGNVSSLTAELDRLTGASNAANSGVKDSDKAISGISKSYQKLVRRLIEGKQVWFDTSNATVVQRAAMEKAQAVIARHTNAIIHNKVEAQEWITLFDGAQNVSLKTRDHILKLIGTYETFGGTLSASEKSWIGQNVAMGHTDKVIKGLHMKIGQLQQQIHGIQGPMSELGGTIKKFPDKKRVKLEADSKQLAGQITEQGKKLDKLGKTTYKPKLGLEDRELHQRVTQSERALRNLERTKTVPKVDVDNSAANAKLADTQAKANQLDHTSINIPVNVYNVVDPYQFGAEIGLKVAAGARAALQSHSPSKVFIKIGKDILRGLLIGLTHAASIKQLQGAVKKITDIIKGLPADLTKTFKLLQKGTAETLNAATNGFQKFMDKLSNLRGLIGDLRENIKQHIKDIKDKIKDLEKTIADKSTKATEKANAILQKNRLSEQLKQWLDVSKLPNTLSAVGSKLESWGRDLQRRMQALNERVQSFVGDFRSGFTQGTDIVSALGGEPDKKNINVRKFFREKIALAKKWARTLRVLSTKGLNPALLQELAAAGPDALPLAQEILRTGVKFVNKQQNVLDTIMGKTQKFLVNTVFGDEIDKLATEAKQFRDALNKLVEIIKRAAERTREENKPKAPQGGSGGNLIYHYHAPPRADAKDQIRELSWWWRLHKHGA